MNSEFNISNLKSDYIINSDLIFILILIVSGFLTGINHYYPSMWITAWIGVSLIPIALYFNKKTSSLVIGFIIYDYIFLFSGHTWHVSACARIIGENPEFYKVFGLWITSVFVMIIPKQIPIIVSSIFRNKIKIPMFIWIPIVLMLGEYLTLRFSGISIANWIYAQWKSPFVLRSVGNLGWNITFFICLAASVAFGEAIIKNNIKYISMTILSLIILLFQPSLNNEIPEILYETGSVYMSNFGYRPKSNELNSKIKLLIWPEAARPQRPRVEEGKHDNIKIFPPFLNNNSSHIIGQITLSKKGKQNSALALSPEGKLIESRSKKILFPGHETPFLGMNISDKFYFVPGVNDPVLNINGKKIITLICFEQIHSYILTKEILKDADLIVIIASEQVIGRSQEIYDQFNSMAVLLAVETGLPVVRSALQGPSSIISPDGRILANNTIEEYDGFLSIKK